MIKASEARANVLNYESEQYHKVKVAVDEVMTTISEAIEFHSKNGFHTAEFLPYHKSHFQTIYELQTASKIIETILKENEFEIVRNDWTNNILKVRW